MVAENSRDPKPDLRRLYSFGIGSNVPPGYSTDDPEYVAKFDNDEQALKYADKEGFNSVERLVLLLHYPITEEQGKKITENFNKYKNPANEVFDKLNQSLNMEQRELLYKLCCYILDGVM